VAKREKIKSYLVPIISGKLKGKKIEIPAINTTRSSKSILRESLFNTLQYDIIGKGFVEVFAGSGSIALEAISRGASHAWCIEKNRAVFNVLQNNVERLASGEISTILGDSFEEFERVAKEASKRCERVYYYFDPPFAIRENMEDIYDKTMDLIKSIDKDSCEAVIIEYMSSLKLPDSIGDFKLLKNRKFGKSSLAYYGDDE